MAFSLGLIYAIIAMIGFGISDAISKVPSEQIGAKKTIFYRNLFSTLFLAVAFFIFFKDYAVSFVYIGFAFLIAIVGYIPLLTFYKALKRGKVGIITPIANSSVVFTTIFAVVFYGEHLSIIAIFSMAIVFFGMAIALFNFKDLKNSKIFSFSSGLPYALITCFLWGLVFFLVKIPVNVIGPFLTAVVIELGILIMSFFHLKTTKQKFGLDKKSILYYILLVSFFGAVGSLFSNMSIEVYKVSIASAIIFANPIVSIIYGKFAYKEKFLLKEIIAVALMIIGIIIMAYYV